jgi:hypothetical protein
MKELLKKLRMLLGMAGISKAGLAEALGTSDTLLEAEQIAASAYARTESISEEDKRTIMAYVGELFGMSQGQDAEPEAERISTTSRITKEEAQVIMAHIDELFAPGNLHDEGKLA